MVDSKSRQKILTILLWWYLGMVWPRLQPRSSTDLTMQCEKGQRESGFNQKWSCLPPSGVTERAPSDAGESQASTQPPDRTSLICRWSRGGRSEEGVTKARALGVIRKGHMSRFGPGSQPERPSKGQELQHNQEKPPRRCFRTQVWIWPCAVRYTERWCVFTCGSFGAVEEREGGRKTG